MKTAPNPARPTSLATPGAGAKAPSPHAAFGAGPGVPDVPGRDHPPRLSGQAPGLRFADFGRPSL